MRGEDEARRPWQDVAAGEDGGDYTADPGVSEIWPQGHRARHAEGEWKEQARRVLAAAVNAEWLETARAPLVTLIDQEQPELQLLQESLELDTSGLDLPPPPVVLPNSQGLPSRPTALFDSRESWSIATRRIVAERALAGEL